MARCPTVKGGVVRENEIFAVVTVNSYALLTQYIAEYCSAFRRSVHSDCKAQSAACLCSYSTPKISFAAAISSFSSASVAARARLILSFKGRSCTMAYVPSPGHVTGKENTRPSSMP